MFQSRSRTPRPDENNWSTNAVVVTVCITAARTRLLAPDMMTETWNYKPMDLLKKARLGNTDELNSLISSYKPFAVTNEDFSVLLILRKFNVKFWNEERRITNLHPENENFQYGITIARSAEDVSSESNIYLPNHLNYKELKLNNQEIEIITDQMSVKTNVTELFRKLKFFKLSISEQEIEEGFNKLCNQVYQQPKTPTAPKIKIIELPLFGQLNFDEKFNWYQKKVTIEHQNVEFTIDHTTPKKLQKLISFAESQMKSKFYEKILLEMEEKMVALKNDVWLSKDEHTGKAEPPISTKAFRKRISIASIGFHEDCSAVIYCNDGDIFWGHQIQIRVDQKGTYQDADLVG